MKTLKLTLFLLILSFSGYSQEGLKVSLHGGLPIGDIAEGYIANGQANVDYLFHITRHIHYGLTAGYSHFLGKNSDGIDRPDLSYLPLGGTLQFHLGEIIKVGADFGYGVVLDPEGVDGSFFYAPEFYYTTSEYNAIILSYRSLSIDGGNVSAITIGFEWSLL